MPEPQDISTLERFNSAANRKQCVLKDIRITASLINSTVNITNYRSLVANVNLINTYTLCETKDVCINNDRIGLLHTLVDGCIDGYILQVALLASATAPSFTYVSSPAPAALFTVLGSEEALTSRISTARRAIVLSSYISPSPFMRAILVLCSNNKAKKNRNDCFISHTGLIRRRRCLEQVHSDLTVTVS